jgi:glycosyltransferase involved in cell wall biosynthesis
MINRNYGKFLREAFSSVLNQTLLPKEIIIIDDCTDDDSINRYNELYLNILTQHLNISLVICYNAIQKGVLNSRNIAVKHSSEDYLCFLDADDYLDSNYLEETSKLLDSNQDIGIIYTDFILFDELAGTRYAVIPTEELGGEIKKGFYKRVFPEFNENSKNLLQERNFIHGGSLFRRKCFDQVNGYTKSNIPEDYNLYKKIIESGWNAKKCNTTNLYYRQHSTTQFNIIGEK